MRSNPLAAINSVAVAIGRFSGLNEMLEYALDRVLEVVQAEAGGVYLLDEDRGDLDLVVHRGLPEALWRAIDHLKLGEGLSGRVALTGEPIVIRNLKDDSRVMHDEARHEGLRGFASVPLRSNFKTYGTLNIHTHADRMFSEEDVQLLTSMASQIGLAVANTRLSLELQASERKLRGLVENPDDSPDPAERQAQIANAERLADLGRMAATIAHEIRNPLGAIVNSINALRHPRAVGDHRLLDIITEEAGRLDGIIKEFLMFARPPVCVPIVCDVEDLIETTAMLFKRSEHLAAGVELRCSCPPNLPAVLADSNQLRQALWNLMSNAVDATGVQGAVDVDASVSVDGRRVSLAVTDDGPGVRDATQILEPFFTTKANGTGLGLTVVARIVRHHGGVIRVENIAGRGARFSFSVPVAVPVQPAAEIA